ncbi:hypothetical protein UUU_34790 [Klebsiella pneumoniae subsp. pneumoniae DSM 30104 = JCM 1662 = NBRC 14940]|nr:hypothetical protein UUU_34790 [Klebsiella pneumoniae subsp. pneumoniae DSM 30104 = JCM 1662 = NBRC 14940]
MRPESSQSAFAARRRSRHPSSSTPAHAFAQRNSDILDNCYQKTL